MSRITEELRDMTAEELAARLADAEEELANLRFQHGSGQLESPIRVRTVRRNVARIQSILNEKTREQATPANAQS